MSGRAPLSSADLLALKRMAKGVLEMLEALEASYAAAGDPAAEARAKQRLVDALNVAAFEIEETVRRAEALGPQVER